MNSSTALETMCGYSFCGQSLPGPMSYTHVYISPQIEDAAAVLSGVADPDLLLEDLGGAAWWEIGGPPKGYTEKGGVSSRKSLTLGGGYRSPAKRICRILDASLKRALVTTTPAATTCIRQAKKRGGQMGDVSMCVQCTVRCKFPQMNQITQS